QHLARGADLQNLRRRRGPTHLGEPLSVGPRHTRHRFPHSRSDRGQARHRKNRADRRACRHRLRAQRGNGRRTLRAPYLDRVCVSAVGVELKWTAFNGDNTVAFSHNFWPASTTNIPPNSDYAFETMNAAPRGKWTYTAEPVQIHTW